MKTTPPRPSRSPISLAPGHALAEQEDGKDGGEHRIGADDQGGQPRRYGLEGDVADAEIYRLVGDAECGENQHVAL